MLPLQIPVVTIYTTSCNVTKSCFLPTQCIYVFCMDLRTNRIICAYSVDWLVFITAKQCVYCAVRTESLHIIQVKFSLRRNDAEYTYSWFVTIQAKVSVNRASSCVLLFSNICSLHLSVQSLSLASVYTDL